MVPLPAHPGSTEASGDSRFGDTPLGSIAVHSSAHPYTHPPSIQAGFRPLPELRGSKRFFPKTAPRDRGALVVGSVPEVLVVTWVRLYRFRNICFIEGLEDHGTPRGRIL